ncbi:tol-pal system protein YbgF [Neptuniibacter sp. QD29_5]|uniref:tol-pal system protein YbgF n=1 Tax=Neptuniibacter sp. QD29_5 TaxID=3398207 RepID=UPI0039F4664F
MTSNSTVLSTALALAISANVVAEEVPVIELGVGASPTNVQQPSYNTHSASKNSELLLIVQQLQDEVRSLRGQVEQQDYRLKQMERQQLERYRDLDGRITALRDPALTPLATTGQLGVDNTPVLEGGSSVSRSQMPADIAPLTPSVGDAQAYREAFGLVKLRNFPKAAEAFSAFVKDYPQSVRLPNAHYWLGEIYLAEQKPEQARESFVQVLTQFADNPKAPDAAYKLGIIYNQLGDTAKATEYLDLVINKYPDSDAVRLAQEFKRQL